MLAVPSPITRSSAQTEPGVVSLEHHGDARLTESTENLV